MFRSRRALGGTVTPRAFSTALTEARACALPQLPQMRSREQPGVPRVAALEDPLQAAVHLRRAPRVGHDAAEDVDLDPKRAVDAGDGVVARTWS